MSSSRSGHRMACPPPVGVQLVRSCSEALSNRPTPTDRPCAETWVGWGEITHNGWCPMGGVRFFGGYDAWVARLDRGEGFGLKRM